MIHYSNYIDTFTKPFFGSWLKNPGSPKYGAPRFPKTFKSIKRVEDLYNGVDIVEVSADLTISLGIQYYVLPSLGYQMRWLYEEWWNILPDWHNRIMCCFKAEKLMRKHIMSSPYFKALKVLIQFSDNESCRLALCSHLCMVLVTNHIHLIQFVILFPETTDDFLKALCGEYKSKRRKLK